jgi:uncharacterized protein (TIGR02646 family)
MRHIQKAAPPGELEQWFKNQPFGEDGVRINCDYSSMPADVRKAVKQRLLEDQGWLCCYTGIRLSKDRMQGSEEMEHSHIEHVKPQSQCQGHEDFNYGNLLAAHPGPHDPHAPFGAHAKGDWYDPDLLVSPLDPRCETKFRFDSQGRILPANADDNAARETIKRLQLAHEALTELRQQAIQAALFPGGQRRSEAQLRQIAESFCRQDQRRASLPAFCFVIAQAAREVLHMAERERRRRQERQKQRQT